MRMMKLIRNNILYIYCPAVLFFILMAMNGCSDEKRIEGGTDEYAHIALSVRT